MYSAIFRSICPSSEGIHIISSTFTTSEGSHSRAKPKEWPERDTGLFDLGLDTDRDEQHIAFVLVKSRFGSVFCGRVGHSWVMKNHSLDAIVMPTYFALFPSAMIGSTAVIVPMGVYPRSTPVILDQFGNQVIIGRNIPFGISFLGDLFSEEALIGMAYAYEQRTMVKDAIKPILHPATELRDIIGNRLGLDADQELSASMRLRCCIPRRMARLTVYPAVRSHRHPFRGSAMAVRSLP